MKQPVIIAILTLSLVCVVLLIAIGQAPPVANAAGIAHDSIPSMRAGGDGAARLAHIGSYAFYFQCAVLTQFVGFILLGISEKRRDTGLYITLAASLLVLLFVWYKIYDSHQIFLATNNTEYFLGFPTAAAWQVYGVWLSGIPLVVFYVAGFKKYIYSDEDEAAFEKLIDTYREGNNAVEPNATVNKE